MEEVSVHLQYPEAVATEEGAMADIEGVMADIEGVELVFPSFFRSSALEEEAFLAF